MRGRSRGRPSGRARGTLSKPALERGWPYVAEFDLPANGLVQVRGLNERLGDWLRDSDSKHGSAHARYRRRFRTEDEADAFVAAFADVGARRGDPTEPRWPSR